MVYLVILECVVKVIGYSSSPALPEMRSVVVFSKRITLAWDVVECVGFYEGLLLRR